MILPLPLRRNIRRALTVCFLWESRAPEASCRDSEWSSKNGTPSPWRTPSSVRMEINEAKRGGVFDSRNGMILKIYSLIDVGEHAGSGIAISFTYGACNHQSGLSRRGLCWSSSLRKTAIRVRVEETIMTYLADHSEAKHRKLQSLLA